MTITIDEEAAITLLEMAVEERGSDFIYKDYFGSGACDYATSPINSSESCPACLIGLGLNKFAGLTVEQLDELNGSLATVAGFDLAGAATTDPVTYIQAEVFDLGDSPLARFNVQLTEGAVRILQAAQSEQDQGACWGDALTFAREVADLLVTA